MYMYTRITYMRAYVVFTSRPLDFSRKEKFHRLRRRRSPRHPRRLCRLRLRPFFSTFKTMDQFASVECNGMNTEGGCTDLKKKKYKKKENYLET